MRKFRLLATAIATSGAIVSLSATIAPAASAEPADVERCVKSTDTYDKFKECVEGKTVALTYECESTETWQTPDGEGRKGRNCIDSNGAKESFTKGESLQLKDKKSGTTYTCDKYIELENGSVKAGTFCTKPR